MKLSDVMSHAGLSGYAELGLVLFMIAFVAILIRTFAPGRRRELEANAQLPFDDAPLARETDDDR